MSSLHTVLLLSLLVATAAKSAPAHASASPEAQSAQHDQDVLDTLLSDTQRLLTAAGIDATVTARVKSPESVLAKMKRKGLAFHEIYDRLALRIHVNTEADCYAARAIVEGQHAAILTERDDYISNPKANGYQSLHSAVRTSGGDVAEFQIRTHAMHTHAEQGGAAHDVYKLYA